MRPEQLAEFEKLAPQLGSAAEHLRSLSSGSAFVGVISAADVQYLCQQTGWSPTALALFLVNFAQLYAVVPVSNYHVGAVAIGASGAFYYGANYEFAGAALSFTLHAEQSAISNAWINDELWATTLAISAPPCGYCRQFLYELNKADQLMIALPGQSPLLLTSYLPDPFGPGDLGMPGRLLQPQQNGLTQGVPPLPYGQTLFNHADVSYAQYTKSYAAVAVATSDWVSFGRLAENAAYNPSLSPLEMALSQLALANRQVTDIVSVALVQADGPGSQVSATEAALACVAPHIQLQVYPAS